MIDDKIPFAELPLFNKLIKDYLSNSSDINLPNYPTIDNFPSNATRNCDRELLKKRLILQNENIVLDDKSKHNIDQIVHHDSYTITTGHQLCLLTGPMYFVNKICSVIALTNRLNQQQEKHHYIPVFWMATEDHDFDEINHFHLFGKTHSWKNNQNGAVGRMTNDGIVQLLEGISETTNLNDKANDFLQLAIKSYKLPTLAEATRYLVNEIFKGSGLVIIDGDDPELKHEMTPFFTKELLYSTSHNSVIETNNELKSNGYTVQVNPREINLFYLLENDRQRIIKEDGDYRIKNTSLIFTEEEIIKELSSFPEKFSPNVILRPLYQEVILPNVAYIGGGGEISYWLQLEKMFLNFSVAYPNLLVRDSALFIRKKTFDIKEKNNLSWSNFFSSMDDLSKLIAQKDSVVDFSNPVNDIANIYDKLIEDLDISLKGTIASEKSKTLKGIQNIEKRTIKNIKKKNEVRITRVLNAKKQLFPAGRLQERFSNYLELLATFDKPLIPMMIHSMNPLDKTFHFYIEE